MIVPVDDRDVNLLRRCVDLAAEALAAGDEPFGSILVDAGGRVLAEDRNRVGGGDHTRHPEFALARWAADHLTPADREAATVYTSGEHCPMCAAAHAWVGLGRVVYASSAEQLASWLRTLAVPPPPVRMLPIRDVAPGVAVEGPAPGLAERVRDLHRRFHRPTSPTRLVTSVDVDGHEADPSEMSVSARHEAELADGGRVVLLDDRGWGLSRRSAPGADEGHDIWAAQTVDDIRATARVVVGPDEPFGGRSSKDMADEHWTHLQQTLRRHGIAVDAARLRRLPHDIVLSERVLARLGGARGDG